MRHSVVRDSDQSNTPEGTSGPCRRYSQMEGHMLHGHQAAVDDTIRWKRIDAKWRNIERTTLPLAFTHLKNVLSAAEYQRMVHEWEAGHREVRIENGYVVTSLTPQG
jgi:hypothetical protein